MLRREFLGGAGLALGTSILSPGSSHAAAPSFVAPGDWAALRNLFPLTREYIHLSTFLLASHPKPVSDEIERHRAALDANPSDYWHQHYQTIDGQVSAAAATYMGGEGHQIALTDSTTMSLAMIYGGLKLEPGEEILQTVHDHYSTDMSIAHRAQRTGATVRRVKLYDDPAQVTAEAIVERLISSISPKTRR